MNAHQVYVEDNILIVKVGKVFEGDSHFVFNEIKNKIKLVFSPFGFIFDFSQLTHINEIFLPGDEVVILKVGELLSQAGRDIAVWVAGEQTIQSKIIMHVRQKAQQTFSNVHFAHSITEAKKIIQNHYCK